MAGKSHGAIALTPAEREQLNALLRQKQAQLRAQYDLYELHAAYTVRPGTPLEQRCWEIRAHNEAAMMERLNFMHDQLQGSELLQYKLAVTAPRGSESRWGLGMLAPPDAVLQLPPGWQYETDRVGGFAEYRIACPHPGTKTGRRLLKHLAQPKFYTLSGPTIARIFTEPLSEVSRIYPLLYPRHWGDIYLSPTEQFVVFTPHEWRQHADCDAADYADLDDLDLTHAITETDIWFAGARFASSSNTESETENNGGNSDLPD